MTNNENHFLSVFLVRVLHPRSLVIISIFKFLIWIFSPLFQAYINSTLAFCGAKIPLYITAWYIWLTFNFYSICRTLMQ